MSTPTRDTIWTTEPDWDEPEYDEYADFLEAEDLAIDAELTERSVGLDAESLAVQARIDQKEEKR